MRVNEEPTFEFVNRRPSSPADQGKNPPLSYSLENFCALVGGGGYCISPFVENYDYFLSCCKDGIIHPLCNAFEGEEEYLDLLRCSVVGRGENLTGALHSNFGCGGRGGCG